MCKIIAIYNQTFVKENATNEMVCKFQRIMKHNTSQFFVIKATVSNIIALDQGLIFLKNMPIINMKCNSMVGDNLESNHWYLGSLNDPGCTFEMQVDNIPLDSFIIYNLDTSNLSDFLVNFQVELRE